METSKDYKNGKFFSLRTPKNLLASMLIGFCFVGSACNDKNQIDSGPGKIDQTSLSASTSNQIEPKAIGSGLGHLYLENFHDPARNQLAKLLINESYKKLLFQFYKRKDGRLTLVAFAGKLNDKEFNPNYQILGVADDTVVPDIENAEVFLGDQKLENDAGFKMLKDALNVGSKNDTSKNYVIFSPELKRFSPGGASVIEFSIGFVSSLSDLSAQILPAGGSRKLNPSPPY